MRAITTGEGYGNHGSFALPESEKHGDRNEEHETFDALVRKSKGETAHIEEANVDVDTENEKRIQETTILDQFSVNEPHSLEKFRTDADALKPHVEEKISINVIRRRYLRAMIKSEAS